MDNNSLNTSDVYNPALNTYNTGGARKYDVLIAGSIFDTSLSPNQFVATDADSQLVSRNLVGTNKQVNVDTSGNVTVLSTPQNIDVSANPVFKNLTLTDLSANSLMGTDASGHFVGKGLSGTINQVIVTPGTNTYTLSTPQDIATTSTPTFGAVTLTSPATNTLIGTDSLGTLVGKSLLGTTNQVIVTPGTNSYTLSLPQSIATFSSPTFGNIIANGTITTSGLNTVAGGATVYVNDPGFSFQNSKLWLNCSNTPSNRSIQLRLDGAGSYGYLDCSGINGIDFTLYGTPLIRLSLGAGVNIWQWLRMGQTYVDPYFGCENPTGKFHWQFSPYSGDAMTLDCSGNIYSPSTQPCTDPSGNGSANYGALVVKGGIGCNEVYASTNISANNSVVGYTLAAGNRVTIFGVTNSTSTSTGAFINNGGCGIAKDVYIGGLLNVTGAITASNLSGTNTGNVTLTAVGSSPNANGASISGQAVTFQPADGSNPGVVTAGTQTFGGPKTFTSGVNVTVSGGTGLAMPNGANIQINRTANYGAIQLAPQANNGEVDMAFWDNTNGFGGASGNGTLVGRNIGATSNGLQIYSKSGARVTTTFPDTGGIILANTTAGYTPSVLDFYERASVSLSFTGAWSGSVSFLFTRIGALVTMTWPDFANTATANDWLRSSSIPARFGSTNNVRMVAMGSSGGTSGPVIAWTQGTGLQFWWGTNYGAYPSGTSAGVAGGSLSWNI